MCRGGPFYLHLLQNRQLARLVTDAHPAAAYDGMDGRIGLVAPQPFDHPAAHDAESVREHRLEK